MRLYQLVSAYVPRSVDDKLEEELPSQKQETHDDRPTERGQTLENLGSTACAASTGKPTNPWKLATHENAKACDRSAGRWLDGVDPILRITPL
jgi:hypothetical protein